MKPIYTPSGAAKEYGDLAINIYTGCPHGCFYCYAPRVLHKDRQEFHTRIQARDGIVEAVKAQLAREGITGKLIHLCFTCDPYPHGYDTSATRAIIMMLKDAGNHVQILTKNTGRRDFDILDDHDWYGATIDGTAPLDNDWVARRITDLKAAHENGIKTWVSFEPVVCAERVLDAIRIVAPFTDKVKIGKLNYCYSDIDWKAFGEEAECLCKNLGLDYYIKDSLRKLMNGGADNG